jgi:LDH2 family malate/lactate/ureidoglycolate dehydrogenase
MIDENKITSWVPFDRMKSFMIASLESAGVPRNDAVICADILIAADMRGIDSHGFNRLKPIYLDRIKQGIQQAVTRVEIVKETPATAVIDGHDGMGMVISKKAMEMAIEKAKIYGLGMTAVRNSTHYGIAGYYPLMAVEEGMVGITGTNARPSIAPTFGIENMLGTNPLTFAMPSDEEFPFFLDCATSVTQRGKIEVYARSGKACPDGWVINEDGTYAHDSRQILKDLVKGTNALVPLGGMGEETGGYKGYGYAAVVEILSSALQGGAFMKMLLGFDNGKQVPYRLGHFFIAVNIDAFTSLDSFKKTTGDILRELRASAKMPGAERIYTPGEKEHLAWLYRKDKGVPLNDDLIEEIREIIREYRLTGFDDLVQ